jgi:shikimate kinase
MGTGKTTVGRVVARRIGFKCVDSDHEIERVAGKPIAEIFSSDGEAAFRGLEREFIEKGHAASRLVVACGGGLVVQAGMLDLLATKGVVVCLHASIDTILARTGRHAKVRPLLDVEDPTIYRSAGTVILTDSRPLGEIASHVVRVWRRESVDYARGRAT